MPVIPNRGQVCTNGFPAILNPTLADAHLCFKGGAVDHHRAAALVRLTLASARANIPGGAICQ